MAAYYYNLADGERRNFIHLAIGEEWENGLNNSGGPTLKTRIDNPNVAELLSDVEVSPGVSKVKWRGKGTGNTLVRGFDPDGAEQALTQLVVRQPISDVALADDPLTPGVISKLDTSKMASNKNAELILTLNLFLQQNPSRAGASKVKDSNNREFTSREWKATEWTSFGIQVKRQGERYFSNKFWLKTPNQYFPLVKDGYVHHVSCQLQINIVSSPVIKSYSIMVIKVLPSEQFKFRSNDEQYQIYDINASGAVCGAILYPHSTILHELTHALGQDHIGTIHGVPGCTPSNQGADNCYGVTPRDCGNVLGAGLGLAAINADPWKKRIAQHTGTQPDDWKVSLKRIPPTKI